MAIKVEPASSSNRQLEGEFKIMRVLKDGVGIPRALYFEKQKESNVMVMDLLGPSLEDLFSYCKNRFSLKTVCMLAEEMILRVEYMHKMGFIHRDIKPDNIMLASPHDLMNLVHIDFGLSRVMDEEYISSYVGTKSYMCPEILTCRPYTKKADIWSLGATIYAM